MIPYLIVLLIIILNYATSIKFSKWKGFQISLIILLLFSGLRGSGDWDYFVYLAKLSGKNIQSIGDIFSVKNYPFEYGFRILDYLHYILNMHPQVVIFTMNLLSISAMYLVIKKQSKIPNLSVLIFFPMFLYFDMHHSRNAVALSFGLLLIVYVLEKKVIKGLISFLIALLFHKSSIVLIVIFPFFIPEVTKWFYKISLKNKLLFLIAIALFVTFFNPLEIVGNIIELIGLKSISNKYTSYISNPRWSYPYSLLDPRFLILISSFLFSNLNTKKKDIEDNQMAYFDTIMFLGILITVLLSNSTILVTRVAIYLTSVSVLYIPLALSKNTKFIYKILKGLKINNAEIAFVLIYVLYSVALITRQVPYKLFF